MRFFYVFVILSPLASAPAFAYTPNRPVIQCAASTNGAQLVLSERDNFHTLTIDYVAPGRSNRCDGGCGAQISQEGDQVTILATLNQSGIVNDGIKLTLDASLLQPGGDGKVVAEGRGEFQCRSTADVADLLILR